MIATLRTCGILLSLAMLVTSPAFAGSVKLYDNYGNTNGGEFKAQVVSPLPFVPIDTVTNERGVFETFCLEKNEYIAFDTEYFAAVGTAALHGGLGGGDPDPLDPRTAYLYQQFVTGNLTDYAYAVGDGGVARAASADALQHVIWYIEEEEAKTWIDGDNSLMDRYYRDAIAHAGPTIGDARVLNLWTDAAMTQPAQDQLVLTPEPAVTALLALGLGLGLFGRTRRGA